MADEDREREAITQCLIAWSEGRQEALDRLLPLVYEDLHRQATRFMKREQANHALQPTALVHEAYPRLIDQRKVKWRNRAHFFGVAAGMMRRIQVDHARLRRAEKRGGGWERVTLVGDEVRPRQLARSTSSLSMNRSSGSPHSTRDRSGSWRCVCPAGRANI